MTGQATIESATRADLDAIAELWVRLARGQRDHGSYVRAEPNREPMRDTLAAHLHTDTLLVARANGDLVGFASFSIERGSLELDATRGLLSNLYVEPDHRGRGIGAALLEAAEAELADRGAEVMILEVMADNEAARRFYRDRGYDAYRIGMERRIGDPSENDTHSKEDG